MYGNGWPGPTASGVSTGIDLALEARRELGELLLGAVVDAADDDPLRGERRAAARRAQSCACRAVSSSTRSRISASASLRRAAVGRAHVQPAAAWPMQAGDAHHEELVEVRREDRAELHALEQRDVRVGGELEHARVEVEPRELAVEQPRCRAARVSRPSPSSADHRDGRAADESLSPGARPPARRRSYAAARAGAGGSSRVMYAGRGRAEVLDDRGLALLAGQQRLPRREVLGPVEVAARDRRAALRSRPS